MKNLTVYRVTYRSVQSMEDIAEQSSNQQLLEHVQCTINPDCNDIYILLGEELYIMFAESEFVSKFNISTIGNYKIIAIDYSVSLQELYCAYESGFVAKIEIRSNCHFVRDMVHASSSGLQCMKLSPDHELMAAVTGTGVVITMVLDFHVVSEVDLYSEEFGQNEFVDVGWGRRETQFHGSKGKAAAQAKPEELIPNTNDDGCIKISWREDGAFFVVNFLHKITKIREFKVFSRTGVLCYTSNPINGLEKCIAWRPSGSLIAIPQALEDRYVVAFFEKNGLKYSELSLPFKRDEARIKDLLWSPCSSILTVVSYQPNLNSTTVQLWTENNGYWYIKQTFVFYAENPLIYAVWNNLTTDRTDKMELIFLTTKELTSCSFNWCVNHSRGNTADDKVVIGVIDGNKILVTGYRDGLVPPPMAHQYLETHEPVNAIVFAPSIDHKASWPNSNAFCTVSCNNRLTFFKQTMDSSTLTYEVQSSYGIDCDILYHFDRDEPRISEHFYHMHHFLWFTVDIMLFSIITKNHNYLCVLYLDETNSENRLSIWAIYNLDYSIEYIVSSPDANTAYIKTEERIFKYTRNGGLEQTDITLKNLCSQVEVIKVDSEDVILALSQENSFFVNGREFSKNITSFYVHSDFLLLTTLQHTLICASLNKNGIEQLSTHDLTVTPELPNTSYADICIRRLEKGSCIIASIPQDSKIILQMPRGNIECIQPRILSLHSLKFHLNSCNYLTVLDIMTRQRINLNLIYDHNPQLFRDNVQKFVEDIVRYKKISWLNLFLAELQNRDVTRTMYANCYENRTVQSNEESNTTDNKVDEICKLLRDIMEKRADAHNLVQPILLSLVRNQQRDGLENALRKVKDIKMLEDSQRSPPESASDALKYILLLVNVNVLYDIALGMYDLELVMFVASKSSKDPKEYIPFLNNLKSMDTNHMKYSIDMYLKRYESAFKHISKDPTRIEECLDLICNQKLYKIAIKSFKKNSTEHKRMAGVYGKFLLSEKRYSEAAMMFYRSGDLDKALKTFSMSADNWQDAIAISKEMKLSSVDSFEVYKTLVNRLIAEQKYEHAATILKEYLNDVEEAIALLCEGKLWKRAIRMAFDAQRLDLNETHIKPGVKEHAEHVISQLSKMKEDFLRHKSRLAVVRKEIGARLTRSSNERALDNEPESNTEFPDAISDITSGNTTTSRISRISVATSKSYRSSKNRRKQERKLFSLKEGSAYEDLSLIQALYQVVNNAYKHKVEWCQLIETLIRFELDETAEKIQVETNEFFQLMEDGKSEIWDKKAPSSLVDIEKMEPQSQEMIAPIKSMEQYLTHPPKADATCMPTLF